MKKRMTIMAAAVACMFGFASCDDMNLNIDKLTEADVLGHINVYASNPANTDKGDQYYSDGDTTLFKSAMCNVNLTVMDSIVVDAGSVLVGTKQNMLTANDEADITFPLIGINLRDTVAKTYDINCPVSEISFFEHLDTVNMMSLITTNNTELGNVLVIVPEGNIDGENINAFYIGYSGQVVISQFEEMGTLVKGNINNVQALYITVAQIETIMNMTEEERATIDPLNYFPSITLNGEISSRRANLTDILDALDEME